MALSASAKRAIRVSARRRVFNLRRLRAMRRVLKRITRLAQEGKVEEVRALIPAAYKAIDKAAKRGVIKKNTAARKKSRLMALLRKLGVFA